MVWAGLEGLEPELRGGAYVAVPFLLIHWHLY